MGKTSNLDASESEKKFFEEYPSNANLSNKEDDYLKYGFFHFTNARNLKVGKSGNENESIERVGIGALIGERSKPYEDKKRAYFAIGAVGVSGFLNRYIELSISELMRNNGLDFETAKQKAFERTREFFKNTVCLKLNIRDGIEYDSNDFLTQRNSHTLTGAQIPPKKLALLNVNGSNNGLDVLEYFIKNTDFSKLHIEHDKENYIKDFLSYSKSIEIDSKPQVISSLNKLKLGKEHEEMITGKKDKEIDL